MSTDPFATPRHKRHELKTWPEPYAAIPSGPKTVEGRKDDREFDEGDLLVLREWRPNRQTSGGVYTGRSVYRRVGYILRGQRFGLPPGWCVMSLLQPRAAGKMPKWKDQKRKVPRNVSKARALPTRVTGVTSGGLPSLGKRH